MKKKDVELPDSLWSILKGIFVRYSNDLFIFAAQDHKTGLSEPCQFTHFGKVVMFGTLDCSHNLQTLICVIIIKAIQFQPLVDGHILF